MPAADARPSPFIALAICLVFALPITGWLVPWHGLAATLIRELLFWLMSAAIVAYVLAVEKLPLSSIGWRTPTATSLGVGILGAVVAFAAMAAIYLYLLPLVDPHYAAKAATVGALPILVKVEIVLRAAIFEEIFYRGFMIERLGSIVRSRTVAAVISWAAFTAAHVSYWGWGSVLIAGVGGAVLTVLYLWRRDLSSNMIAHALTDGVALFI